MVASAPSDLSSSMPRGAAGSSAAHELEALLVGLATALPEGGGGAPVALQAAGPRLRRARDVGRVQARPPQVAAQFGGDRVVVRRCRQRQCPAGEVGEVGVVTGQPVGLDVGDGDGPEEPCLVRASGRPGGGGHEVLGLAVLTLPAEDPGQQAAGQRLHDPGLAPGRQEGPQLGLGFAPTASADADGGAGEREPVLTGEELRALGDLETVLDVPLGDVEPAGAERRARRVDARPDGEVRAG